MWSLVLQVFCISATISSGFATPLFHRIQEKGNIRCVQMTSGIHDPTGARTVGVVNCNSTEKFRQSYWEFRSANNSYLIVARDSHLCLKVATFENSGYIVEGGCKSGDASVVWTVKPLKHTPWVNLKSKRPGNWCLSVYDGLNKLRKGLGTEIYKCRDLGRQEFMIIPSVNSTIETAESVNTDLENENEDQNKMTTTVTTLVTVNLEDLNGGGNINSASSAVVTVTTFYGMCMGPFSA